MKFIIALLFALLMMSDLACNSSTTFSGSSTAPATLGPYYGVGIGQGNSYAVSLPAITAYLDGLQIVLNPSISNTAASTLSVSGLPAKPIMTQEGLETCTPGMIRSGIVANLVYSIANDSFTLTTPAVAIQQSFAVSPGLISDFTQNPPQIFIDPSLICSQTGTCAPTGGQDLSNSVFLILPKASLDPSVCTEGQVYYNTTTHSLRLCIAANTWAAS